MCFASVGQKCKSEQRFSKFPPERKAPPLDRNGRWQPHSLRGVSSAATETRFIFFALLLHSPLARFRKSFVKSFHYIKPLFKGQLYFICLNPTFIVIETFYYVELFLYYYTMFSFPYSAFF